MPLQCRKGISTGISVYVHACIHVSVDLISVWAITPTLMEFIHETLRGGCMVLRRCVKTLKKSTLDIMVICACQIHVNGTKGQEGVSVSVYVDACVYASTCICLISVWPITPVLTYKGINS